MSQIHFYPKDKKQKASSIQAYITGGGQRKKIGLGFSVEVSNWNFKSERLNKSKALTVSEQKDNKLLDKIESIFIEYKGEAISVIAEKIKKFVTTGALGKTQTLVEGFNLVINATPKASTKTAYKSTRNVIIAFRDVPFNAVDMDYSDSLTDHLMRSDAAKNTIGKHIKHIKSVMQKTHKRGLHENLKFKDFRVTKEEIDNIALNEEELQKLKDIQLSGLNEAVRDLFLMGCYTGLRFSDFYQINPKAIDDNILTIPQTEKTGESVVIPLKSDAVRIINKYGTLPQVPSNQLFNKMIKKIAESAGIEGSQMITRTIGGIRQTTTEQRSQLIASHTARRTFATLAYKSNVPTLSIMKITGHKTEASFLNYIKVDKKEHAVLISKHPFFQ